MISCVSRLYTDAPPAVLGLIFIPLIFTKVWLLLEPLRKIDDSCPIPPLLLTSMARLFLSKLVRSFAKALFKKSKSNTSTDVTIEPEFFGTTEVIVTTS